MGDSGNRRTRKRASQAAGNVRLSATAAGERNHQVICNIGVVVGVDERGQATITPVGCEPGDAIEILRAVTRGLNRTETGSITRQ